MVEYQLDNVSEDMSFLEMFDVLNDSLTRKGEDPVTFDHDCREIAVRVGCSSTVVHTARKQVPLPVNSICARLTTATQLLLNPGERGLFRSLKI